MKTRLMLFAFILLNAYTLTATAWDYMPLAPSVGYSVNINGGNYPPAYNTVPQPYYQQPVYAAPQLYYPQPYYREHHHHREHWGYGERRGGDDSN